MDILRLLAVLIVLCMSLLGCGGGDSSTDTTKPTVVSTNVPNGATYIPRDLQEIEVVFSEKMYGGSSSYSSPTPSWLLSNYAQRWSSDFSSIYISRTNA